ncbi:MAG: hypothetical protein HN348_31945 [Proteobacteria bacterium]|jgi:hypothetical protein|nr:hypothetical protein [Pseudomonadota bacterium]
MKLLITAASLLLLGTACKTDNCDEGPERCWGYTVQRCLEGEYLDWEECEFPDESCVIEEGSAMCTDDDPTDGGGTW